LVLIFVCFVFPWVSQQDCQLRVIEGWKDLLQDLQNERSRRVNGSFDGQEEEVDHTLVVAHANTLRALVMHLDDISPSEIEDLNIGTALPFYYDIDIATGSVVIDAAASDPSISGGTFRGRYIDDERKRRNFLERRRAANDPWLWALHDDQVPPSMLLVNASQDGAGMAQNAGMTRDVVPEGMQGVEDEAKHNTEVFAASSFTVKPVGSGTLESG
jgi:2,3-bisphosphoglycerate-dependent phosphoglycerate mutase